MKYIEKGRNKIISTRYLYKKCYFFMVFSYLIDCKIEQKETLYLSIICIYVVQ